MAAQSGGSRLSSQHIPALDGIRGIAILVVMMHHFTVYGGMASTNALDRAFRTLTLPGWVGVDLFFVLSGFLITGILYDAKEKRHYFRTFYMRRVLHIFPLYYVVLVIVFLIAPRLFTADAALQSFTGEQWWYWTYLSNVSTALSGWHEYLAFGHFWSLAVEEQFYLLWRPWRSSSWGERRSCVCLSC